MRACAHAHARTCARARARTHTYTQHVSTHNTHEHQTHGNATNSIYIYIYPHGLRPVHRAWGMCAVGNCTNVPREWEPFFVYEILRRGLQSCCLKGAATVFFLFREFLRRCLQSRPLKGATTANLSRNAGYAFPDIADHFFMFVGAR